MFSATEKRYFKCVNIFITNSNRIHLNINRLVENFCRIKAQIFNNSRSLGDFICL